MFDDLIEELEAADYNVEIVERITESRWMPPGDLIETTLKVTVGVLTTKVVDAVTRWAKKRRREEPRRVTVQIYGQDGNVLRKVQIDELDNNPTD